MDLKIRISASATLGLARLERNQLPFAAASAVTAIAKRVQEVETKALAATFNAPTPFTMRAFGVQAARKGSPTATVFAKDAQASYLEPYAVGGLQVLGKKEAMLTPIDVKLNAYGNIPRNKIASLKGRPDIYIGPIRTKAGRTINGVWQRPARPGSVPVKARGRAASKLVASTKLKLLIEFTDPKPVTQRLGYGTRAEATVHQVAPAEVAAALRRAIASAR